MKTQFKIGSKLLGSIAFSIFIICASAASAVAATSVSVVWNENTTGYPGDEISVPIAVNTGGASYSAFTIKLVYAQSPEITAGTQRLQAVRVEWGAALTGGWVLMSNVNDGTEATKPAGIATMAGMSLASGINGPDVIVGTMVFKIRDTAAPTSIQPDQATTPPDSDVWTLRLNEAGKRSTIGSGPFDTYNNGWFTVLPPIIKYTITATAGSGGSIDPAGDVAVNEGSNQNFVITPLTGYQISDVRVDGASVGAVSSYEFTSIKANHTITAVIVHVNRPPVLNPIGDKIIAAGQNGTFTISGSDPDGDKLTYRASNLPQGAYIHAYAGFFNWRPLPAQAGDNLVTFTVSDRKATMSETVNIKVTCIPYLSNIIPSGSMGIGNPMYIYGSNFLASDSSSRVRFQGPQTADVPYTTWLDTKITCKIPNLTPGSYQVSVVTRGGKSVSKPFQIYAPLIIQVAPYRVKADDTVTVTGMYFGEKDIVNISGVNGSYDITETSSWTDMKIVFKAPRLAAGLYTVRVRGIKDSRNQGYMLY